MENKNKLMKNLILIGTAFGYFILSYVPWSIQLIFFIALLLATIVYFFESIKNKYGKLNITMTILGFTLGLNLIAINLMKNKYTYLKKYESFLLISLTCIIITMITVGGINYFKNGNKKQKTGVIIFVIFLTISIVIILGILLLRKCGIISE